jgi:hypothetical protein
MPVTADLFWPSRILFAPPGALQILHRVELYALTCTFKARGQEIGFALTRMEGFMLKTLWPPSPATGISLLALAIALGGTAFAATATLVKITNGGGTHVAHVDASGALLTTSRVAPPDATFSSFQYIGAGASQLMAPTQAKVALTHFIVGNYYDQVSGAPARVTVQQLGSASSADCNTPTFAKTIAVAYANASQSTEITFPHGTLLEPAAAGQYWCLSVYLSLKGNPSSYYLPEFSYGGYVVSGDFTPLAANTSAANTRSPPRNH